MSEYVKFHKPKNREHTTYLVEGELAVGINERHADIELMCANVFPEKIIGFGIDGSANPSTLYFEWRPRGPKGESVRTRIGAINDLKEAEEWVNEVNEVNAWS